MVRGDPKERTKAQEPDDPLDTVHEPDVDSDPGEEIDDKGEPFDSNFA